MYTSAIPRKNSLVYNEFYRIILHIIITEIYVYVYVYIIIIIIIITTS